MGIRTAGDLKNYLEKKNLSPEQLSRETEISNMTIRRILRRPPKTPIAAKYHVQLDFHEGNLQVVDTDSLGLSQLGKDFVPFLKELQESGESVKSVSDIEPDLKRKLAETVSIKALKNNVTHFLELLKDPQITKKEMALILGALLYFINPFDLIPDAIVGVGYLDDLAVFGLVGAYIAKQRSKKKKLTPA